MTQATATLNHKPPRAGVRPVARILLVDNDPVLLRALRRTLRGCRRGLAVDTCPSALAAQDWVAHTRYDVVVSDVTMAGMDELARLARTRLSRPHTPTLLVTWHDERDLAAQALRGGAYDFVHKPINRESFLAAVDRALEMRRLDRQVEEQKQALERHARALEQTVAELQESEARFRCVAQSATDAIISADSRGAIIFWNRGARAIFGYAEAEVLGRPLTLLMPERYRAAHRDGVERLRATGEPRILGKTLEVHGLRKDGAEFPLELSLAGWQTQEGNFYTGIARDISERRQREDEIRRLNDELRQRVAEAEAANKELEAFSYTVSHDLRAPLRAANGFARILLEDYAAEFSPEARRYLDLVRDSARQMGRLIDDLLTFSRLSRQPLQEQPVCPADFVRHVFDELRREDAGRDVTLALGDLPACQADPALLRQVFVNLLANAFKYTRRRAEAVIEVGWREAEGEPGRHVYFVKDNGVGFDMQYAPKLFGVFQRLHRAEDYEGTGVGLAIVQRVVHRHGGRVWAEAAVDRGATFYFTLAQGAPRD